MGEAKQNSTLRTQSERNANAMRTQPCHGIATDENLTKPNENLTKPNGNPTETQRKPNGNLTKTNETKANGSKRKRNESKRKQTQARRKQDASKRKQCRRQKGTGRLFLRGGMWYARWRCNGQETTESTGIPAVRDKEDAPQGNGEKRKSQKELAEEWLMDKTEPLRLRHKADGLAMIARRLQTVEERLAADMAETNRVATVGDLEEMFRNSPRRPDCSEDMLGRYCGIVSRFAESAGASTPVADIGRKEADAYARRLVAGGAASGTFNKAVNALSLVWRTCGSEAGLPDGTNPWDGIARKRGGVHVRRAFTRKETDAILAAATGEAKTLVAVLLYTGLRLGDACTVTWDDFRKDVVHVVTAKGDRKVAIPLHPKLAAVLGKRKKRGFVMPRLASEYARKNGASGVSRKVKRLIERCGIKTSVEIKKGRSRPDATAHSFRHTFITRSVEAGVPPHVVQEIVGHASGAMTEHYTHLSDKTILKAFSGMK